jgi:hyperosmotically inducible periplasmic protein
MRHLNSHRQFLPKFLPGSVILLAGSLIVAGCQHSTARPDEKTAVNNSLNGNNLSSVSVSQDRDKGTMTLTGDVGSDSFKAQDQNLAQQAAPDYTIVNEIGVRSVGMVSQGNAVAADLDSAIESNFKASIKAHKNLDDQSIHPSAKNGTLVLKGTVKTSQQKQEAEDLARQVPNVQQVVNEIEVNPKKHSTDVS